MVVVTKSRKLFRIVQPGNKMLQCHHYDKVSNIQIAMLIDTDLNNMILSLSEYKLNMLNKPSTMNVISSLMNALQIDDVCDVFV